MRWIFLTLILANIVYLGYQLVPESDLEPPNQWEQSDDYHSVQLLSERAGRSDRQKEVEQVLENPISVSNEIDDGADNVDVDEAGCQGLGPFEDVISAQDAAERFNAIGFAVALRAVDEATSEFDYRVVLPPTSSLQEAFRRLRELKSPDIDSYVISQGEDALGISLGVFSNSSGAAQHQQRLAEEGYQAEIREIRRVVRGYWIFGQQDQIFPADQLGPITAENPTTELRETACLN